MHSYNRFNSNIVAPNSNIKQTLKIHERNIVIFHFKMALSVHKT